MRYPLRYSPLSQAQAVTSRSADHVDALRKGRRRMSRTRTYNHFRIREVHDHRAAIRKR